MNEDVYQRYLALKSQGKKLKAKAALQEFLASFVSPESKADWVRAFLQAGDFGRRIRHEIYAQLVFPVLLAGYRQRDGWATLWLARTASNLYAARELHKQVDFKHELDLLEEAYQITKADDLKNELLRVNINWFKFCEHEWPAGILYSFDGASPTECERILEAVSFVRTLDTDRDYETFLNEFEQKVREYGLRTQIRE